MEHISVIVPVYNRAEIFGRSLQSIVEQTYRPIQIIVVDDGSTENIKDVFDRTKKKYESAHHSFLYIRQENKGASVARNSGLAHATGGYVIFWDADTIGQAHMLEHMRDALSRNTEASFAYSSFLLEKKLFRGIPFSFEELKKQNFITTMSLIRRSAVVKWDESLKRFQDWDLWLTMAEQGKKGVWIDEILFQVEGGGTISSWLPSFAYHVPFRWLPSIRDKVREYEAARKIIFNKHHVSLKAD